MGYSTIMTKGGGAAQVSVSRDHALTRDYTLSGDLEEIPVPPEVIEAKSIVDIWLTGKDENTAKCLEKTLQAEYSSRSPGIEVDLQGNGRLA